MCVRPAPQQQVTRKQDHFRVYVHAACHCVFMCMCAPRVATCVVQAMLDRSLLKLIKTLRQVLEVHPW